MFETSLKLVYPFGLTNQTILLEKAIASSSSLSLFTHSDSKICSNKLYEVRR